jgi:hypothetical protein
MGQYASGDIAIKKCKISAFQNLIGSDTNLPRFQNHFSFRLVFVYEFLNRIGFEWNFFGVFINYSVEIF